MTIFLLHVQLDPGNTSSVILNSCYLELKPLYFGFALQSFTTSYFELTLVWTILSFPLKVQLKKQRVQSLLLLFYTSKHYFTISIYKNLLSLRWNFIFFFFFFFFCFRTLPSCYNQEDPCWAHQGSWSMDNKRNRCFGISKSNTASHRESGVHT